MSENDFFGRDYTTKESKFWKDVLAESGNVRVIRSPCKKFYIVQKMPKDAFNREVEVSEGNLSAMFLQFDDVQQYENKTDLRAGLNELFPALMAHRGDTAGTFRRLLMLAAELPENWDETFRFNHERKGKNK